MWPPARRGERGRCRCHTRRPHRPPERCRVPAPILIAIFALFAHRAIRINLLISLVTLAMSAASRASFVPTPNIAGLHADHRVAVGGIVSAWFRRFVPVPYSQEPDYGVIAVLLLGTAGLLAVESMISGTGWTALSPQSPWRGATAVAAGVLVERQPPAGEFIIPILIFIFGADILTAGSASVLISIPVVLAGVVRHWSTGHYRSQSMLTYLVLPMSIGSLVGALIGGYLAAWTPTDALRLLLAAILAVSALKLWSKSKAPK